MAGDLIPAHGDVGVASAGPPVRNAPPPEAPAPTPQTVRGFAGPGFHLSPQFAAIAAIVVIVGIVALDLYWTNWRWGRESHAPVVIAAAAYAFASRARHVVTRPVGRDQAMAIALLPLAFLLFLAGKAQEVIQLEALAIPLLVLSACLALGGRGAVRQFAIIILLLFLAVPLPGSVQDALLLPAKLLLSEVATKVTGAAGLPVALSGAMIYVGYHQLQIADVCSGLDTFFSLLAVGLLLLFFDRPSNARVAIAFLASMLLLAFSVNCLRIVTLIVTIHFLGARAEEQAHDYAAYGEIVVALLLFIGAKSLFERMLGNRASVAGAR